MVKRFNKTEIRFPVLDYEEINEIFWKKIDVQSFYAIFVKFLVDFVD